MSSQTYRADAEAPSYAVEWKDRDGTVINFATGFTFEAKLVNRSTGTVALTKTTGITGAATSPNIVIAWTSGELNVTPGAYSLHLTATTSPGGSDRHFRPGNEPGIVILAAT